MRCPAEKGLEERSNYFLVYNKKGKVHFEGSTENKLQEKRRPFIWCTEGCFSLAIYILLLLGCIACLISGNLKKWLCLLPPFFS